MDVLVQKRGGEAANVCSKHVIAAATLLRKVLEKYVLYVKSYNNSLPAPANQTSRTLEVYLF